MNVIIEKNFNDYVVVEAIIESVFSHIEIRIESNRYNIFNKKLNDLEHKKFIYYKRYRSGQALTSGFKNESDAIFFIKTQNWHRVFDFEKLKE